MADPRKPSLLVITNAEAGTSDEKTIAAALEVLRADADVEVVATSSPAELDDVLGRAAGRTLVVIGGDGSIHAVLQALYDRDEVSPDLTVGLIPLGTGNDFARTVGLPVVGVDADDAVTAATRAARIVVTGHRRPTDLIVDEPGAVTVNSVHLGAGAEAGAKGAKWKKRLGRIGYVIGAAQTALNPPSLRLRVELDGEVVADPRDRVLMVALGNGASVGGGTELTPDAVPHDGRIDVLIATPRTQWARLGFALRLPFARHGEHDDVRLLRGRRVSVTGASFDINSDGELDGPVSERTWTVHPGAYSMLVPE